MRSTWTQVYVEAAHQFSATLGAHARNPGIASRWDLAPEKPTWPTSREIVVHFGRYSTHNVGTGQIST